MRHDPVVLDAGAVAAQIERLKVAYPDMLADAELLAGMVEGETDFDRILDRIVDRILDADAMCVAVEQRLSNLRERRDRFKRRADAYRSVAVGLMKAAGKDKHQLPEASLSIPKRTRVVVYDVAALPQGTFALERVPAADAALRAMIEADGEIPGVRIETLPETLTVRTK
jgi:hypothetical protein